MQIQTLSLAVLSAYFCLACAQPGVQTTRDPLSAGTAELFLKVDETTQAEVLEAFGGPNIVAGGADGRETWTYDRMSYTSTTKSGGGIAGGGGVIGSVPVGGLLWGNAAKGTSSSRTLTLFIYWNDGKLADYKYRSVTY